MSAKEKTASWIVTVKCIVTKQIVVEDCTKAQAINNPWDHVVDEIEKHQDDWKVISVEPNE